MTLGFYNVNSKNDCCVCLEPCEKAVAHRGSGGALHPMHEECVLNCFLNKPLPHHCPFCRRAVDITNLLPLKVRIKLLGKSACEGSLAAGMIYLVSRIYANFDVAAFIKASQTLEQTGSLLGEEGGGGGLLPTAVLLSILLPVGLGGAIISRCGYKAFFSELAIGIAAGLSTSPFHYTMPTALLVGAISNLAVNKLFD
jgi:hypothetical protein